MENLNELKSVIKRFLYEDEAERVYLGFRFAFVWAMINEDEKVFNDEFRAFIKERVNFNKNALKACSSYIGKEYPDGLWGDMCKMDLELRNKKNISLMI